MPKLDDIIVGLDIGTTKVCTVIGQVRPAGIEILGVGIAPSYGLRKGVVVNIDSTVDSITKSIEEAELTAGVEVDSVYAGIAGGHIKGINTRGMVAISSRNREITKADVNRAIDSAKAISIPMDREVIHVFTQEFKVDDQDGIKEPVGMSGSRLEVEAHIVTGAVTSAENIVKSINRAGYQVNDIVLQPFASSKAVMSQEEKELGEVLIDLGGGTTDLVMYINGSIWHTGVLSIGGNHVTNDISIGLRIPNITAENIKKDFAIAAQNLIEDDIKIDLPSIAGRDSRQCPLSELTEIVEAREIEIFDLIARELESTGFKDLISGGVVLTGGGSLLKGTEYLAEKVLKMPVRIGYPVGVQGLNEQVANPIYSTAVGLVLYGYKNIDVKKIFKNTKAAGSSFTDIFERMVSWLKEFF